MLAWKSETKLTDALFFNLSTKQNEEEEGKANSENKLVMHAMISENV